MTKQQQDKPQQPSQKQDSRQSARQGAQSQAGEPWKATDKAKAGIGSSQGQDRESRDDRQSGRPSAGTADIERGSAHDVERGGSQESLVNDSTGAYKERP